MLLFDLVRIGKAFFILLFVIRLIFKVAKITASDFTQEIKSQLKRFHFICLGVIVTAIAYDAIGAAALFVVSIFKRAKQVSKFPIVGGIAKATKEVVEHFRSNWGPTSKYFDGTGTEGFF